MGHPRLKLTTWRKIYPDKICICGMLLTRRAFEVSSNWVKRKHCSEVCENKAFVARMDGMFGMGVCEKCGKTFKKKAGTQRFCGSKVGKEGCSWVHYVERKKVVASRYRMTGKKFLWTNTTKIVR